MRALLLAGAILAAGSAQAAQITSLYNTGVDDSHAVQANGAAELHYSLVDDGFNDFIVSDLRDATSANGYPIPPWLGDDSVSAWTGPVGDSQLDGPVGLYDYRTTFDLTGLSPVNASITGRWASDDPGFGILLNGQPTGNFSCCFTDWSSLSITGGFKSGVNTLDFIVFNQGGPTGLRTELSGTASVPEPTAWTLMIAGFLGVGASLRAARRRSVVTTA